MENSNACNLCFLQVHATKSNGMGVRSGMLSMLKEGGVKSLWRGNGINVIKVSLTLYETRIPVFR